MLVSKIKQSFFYDQSFLRDIFIFNWCNNQAFDPFFERCFWSFLILYSVNYSKFIILLYK